ncbi:MAG: cation:proton antiporter [Candidatus Bathyarchaeota archaeon]|nr:MAG: cation:proton antiporter [Candidatus Bathyarchaeota archaeon]
MLEADKILMLVSSTLIICYVSGLIYSKTRIPDVLWALGFGIILGPVLGYYDATLFTELMPLMSTLALIIILFEAGINVDIGLLVRTIGKTTILSITTIFTIIITVGGLLSIVMPTTFSLLQGMLLGTMIASPCTIACFGILDGVERQISNIGNTRIMLMMESVIADPISIITAISLIRMIMQPDISIVESVQEITFIFIFALGFGFLVGALWAEILHRTRDRPFNYMITLAILLPTYILAEMIIGHGGGPIAVLIFGLTIANYNYITKKVRISRNLTIDGHKLREIHEEITFFIKSFFFVFIGITAIISLEYVLLGLGLFALIQSMRYGIVTVIGRILRFSQQERVLVRVIFALGLPAFVISQLPTLFDPEKQYFLNPRIYTNLTMPIVLGTILFSALVGPVIAKRQLNM